MPQDKRVLCMKPKHKVRSQVTVRREALWVHRVPLLAPFNHHTNQLRQLTGIANEK